MVNVDKIKDLAKKNGISITYLCERVGQKPYYFNDVKKRKGEIPDERLDIIADILKTTKEHLRDEEEPHAAGELLGNSEDARRENYEDTKKFLEAWSKLSPEKKKAVMNLMESIK